MSPIDMDRLAEADSFANSGEVDLQASEDGDFDMDIRTLAAIRGIGWTLQAIFELQRGAFPRRDADG
jgi:hypothetical protein